MATQPPPMPAYQPKQGPSALKIIGIIFLLLVLVCGGCVTYLVMNARSLVTGALVDVLTEMIAQSELPQEQKDRILADIGTIHTAINKKEIKLAQVGTFIERLGDANFINLIVVEAVEVDYMTKVQPDEGRKAEIERVFTRFRRGIVEGAVSQGQVDQIMTQVAAHDGQQVEMKQDLTAEDLEQVLAAMNKAADEAGVPDEDYQVDYAAIIHQVMIETFPELATEEDAAGGREEVEESPPAEETPPDKGPAPPPGG
jgi:hypothetical protein